MVTGNYKLSTEPGCTRAQDLICAGPVVAGAGGDRPLGCPSAGWLHRGQLHYAEACSPPWAVEGGRCLLARGRQGHAARAHVHRGEGQPSPQGARPHGDCAFSP